MTKTQRRQLLERLQSNRISIHEVERQLDEAALKEPISSAVPKHIYVQMSEGGVRKTNMKIPFSLVKAGLSLGKSFGVLGAKYDLPDPVVQSAIEALKGIDITQVLKGIGSGEIVLPYHIIEIDEHKREKPDIHVIVLLK